MDNPTYGLVVEVPLLEEERLSEAIVLVYCVEIRFRVDFWGWQRQ